MNALALAMTKRTNTPLPTTKAADATDLARTLWRAAEHAGRRPNLTEVFAITERTHWPDGFVLIDNGRPELSTIIWCGERLACLLRSPKPSRRMADVLVSPYQGVLDFLGAASRDDRFVEGCLAIAGSGYFRTYTVMAMPVTGRLHDCGPAGLSQTRFLFGAVVPMSAGQPAQVAGAAQPRYLAHDRPA